MKDIDLAKETIKNTNSTLVIVKYQKVIFLSEDKGIKPIYTAVTKYKDELIGSSIADRVTGKAAAVLYKYAGINELYTMLISQRAIEVLKKESIDFSYDKNVPYIKNRNKTDMCPVEKLSEDTENIDILLQKLENFLARI